MEEWDALSLALNELPKKLLCQVVESLRPRIAGEGFKNEVLICWCSFLHKGSSHIPAIILLDLRSDMSPLKNLKAGEAELQDRAIRIMSASPCASHLASTRYTPKLSVAHLGLFKIGVAVYLKYLAIQTRSRSASL